MSNVKSVADQVARNNKLNLKDFVGTEVAGESKPDLMGGFLAQYGKPVTAKAVSPMEALAAATAKGKEVQAKRIQLAKDEAQRRVETKERSRILRQIEEASDAGPDLERPKAIEVKANPAEVLARQVAAQAAYEERLLKQQMEAERLWKEVYVTWQDMEIKVKETLAFATKGGYVDPKGFSRLCAKRDEAKKAMEEMKLAREWAAQEKEDMRAIAARAAVEKAKIEAQERKEAELPRLQKAVVEAKAQAELLEKRAADARKALDALGGPAVLIGTGKNARREILGSTRAKAQATWKAAQERAEAAHAALRRAEKNLAR